jgi:hypothetical protein
MDELHRYPLRTKQTPPPFYLNFTHACPEPVLAKRSRRLLEEMAPKKRDDVSVSAAPVAALAALWAVAFPPTA